nr:MAG TPA: hypothetical protein [Caudoviricetes sp.]
MIFSSFIFYKREACSPKSPSFFFDLMFFIL